MFGRPGASFLTLFTGCFISGILIGRHLAISWWFLLPLAVLLLFLIDNRRAWVMHAAAFIVGLLQLSLVPDQPVGLLAASEYLLVDIRDSRGITRNQGIVTAAYRNGGWKPAAHRVMLFSRDSLPRGNASLLVHLPRVVENANYATPAVFTADIRVVRRDTTVLQQLRYAVIQRLASVLHAGNLGLGMGIFLGDKSYIDSTSYALYRRAGGAHILAVSGLHVGIIYGIIFFISRRLGNRWQVRAVRSVCILLVLWGYAAVTGFAPSVIRAVGFFTILTIAQWRKGPVGIAHALVLLLFLVGAVLPNQLFSVGLQLSYLAVGGILVFQPVFEAWIGHWPGPLRWVARMVTVSLSAQLFTVPLLILYFGGVSIVGVFASLILIPFAFAALVLVIMLVVLGDVPMVADWLNRLFLGMSDSVEGSLRWLTGLPAAYIELELSLFDMIIYYFILILCYGFVRQPSKNLLAVLLLCLIGVAARL